MQGFSPFFSHLCYIMGKKITDSVASFCSELGTSLKSMLKIIMQSRKCDIRPGNGNSDRSLIIMGNGPSLADNIKNDLVILQDTPTMAVNFAANADEFTLLKPDYYLLADPHFFEGRRSDPNVEKMFERFNNEVDWEMTLFVPAKYSAKAIGITNQRISVKHFNPVGVEGFGVLERAAFSSGRGMPRPRNVLIPAIMTAMLLGYKEIYILGADHSWIKTLDVNSDNEVVSVQPHFYKDNNEEQRRVTSVYKNVKLHEILLSFHLAFKSYHTISRYAASRGIDIYNSTPGSYIDAFRRKPLPGKQR